MEGFDYTKILNMLDRDNGYQILIDSLPGNWRILVELNEIIRKYGVSTWWYAKFIEEREIFLLSDKTTKRGKKKSKTLAEIKKFYSTIKDDPIFRFCHLTPKKKDQIINYCVIKIMNDKYIDFYDNYDLKEIEVFLEVNKREINDILRYITYSNRGLIPQHLLNNWNQTYDQGVGARLGPYHSFEEAKKFANPIYTVFSMIDDQYALKIPYTWFLELIGGEESWPYGVIIKTSDRLLDIISENSIKIMKLLLNIIEPDVLNSHSCINPLYDIITHANMNFPSRPIDHTGNLFSGDDEQNKKLNRMYKTSLEHFKSLLNAGLLNQTLDKRYRFDCIGLTTGEAMNGYKRIASNNTLNWYFSDFRNQRERYLSATLHNNHNEPNDLYDLCHVNLKQLIRERDLRFQKFQSDKRLKFSRGFYSDDSPVRFLDEDSAVRVINDLNSLNQYPSFRRNLIIRESEKDKLISSLQRLNISRGLGEFSSPISEGLGVDMEMIQKIMEEHQQKNLLELGYPENKMTKEFYLPPERSNSPGSPTYSPGSPQVLRSDNQSSCTSNDSIISVDGGKNIKRKKRTKKK
jgi:hypothetical protein